MSVHIKLEAKSKLSSSEWKELGLMLRALQDQELNWQNEFHEKQTETCFIAMLWPPMTASSAKKAFKDDKHIFTARDPKSNEIVGFCSVEEKPELGWSVCNGLFVKPKWRRKGVAAMLLTEALAKTRVNGLDSLELRVSTKNKGAKAFYKKLGFSPVSFTMEKWVR